MSAALFCSLTMAVNRAALMAPVAAVAAATAAPSRPISGEGKTQVRNAKLRGWMNA